MLPLTFPPEVEAGGVWRDTRNMNMRFIFAARACLALALAWAGVVGVWAADSAAGGVKALPLAGESFLVNGRAAFIIPSKAAQAAISKPWVWYAPTLPGLPGKEEVWMFERFLEAGISVAGIDVGESYGSPAGRRLFTEFHAEMSGARGYSAKPVLLGRSRGGLMTLAWAAENPGNVAAFAGIYPVCNLASHPGVAGAAGAYGMTAEELAARLGEHNPVDRLGGLASSRVPLFAIHGDQDVVVPLEANSGLVRTRYVSMGGETELVVPPGQGHSMWAGFFESQELAAFVKRHAGPVVELLSPLENQVFQRATKASGPISIRGRVIASSLAGLRVEARLVVGGVAGAWRELPVEGGGGGFESVMEAPAGGWHRVEVRALSEGKSAAEAVVGRVGMGEVFVVAGQSNSANHGAERQKPRSPMVMAFDGHRWLPANDPQPGASGGGGSFLPPFGDEMAGRFGVPVGLVACGIGATSVREWLPAGVEFPNPPTLTGNVRQLEGGGWESSGSVFADFAARVKRLGPRGFRCVLWHQGESDANQRDPSRTLAGPLHRRLLEMLIRRVGSEIGWDAPWFVAQASYHAPGDEASPEIRAAQASLWADGVALEGPDTDQLKSEFRDEGGRGVHFSGAGLREHAARWVEKVAPWLERRLQ